MILSALPWLAFVMAPTHAAHRSAESEAAIAAVIGFNSSPARAGRPGRGGRTAGRGAWA